PPLTKALWKGEPESGIFRAWPDGPATFQPGRRITSVDPASHSATDDRCLTYTFGKLLLATGGTPRTLPGAPEGVVYLRTLDDSTRLRTLPSATAAVII